MMQVTIDIPEKLAERLQAYRRDISRHLLERLVLEAYRDDILTTRDVQEALGLAERLAVYDLCDKHHIATYTLADVQRDRDTTQRLGF
jgi:ABC-type taurine transport system ATPase subunit